MKNEKRKLEVVYMPAPAVYDVARSLIQTESDHKDLIELQRGESQDGQD